MTKIASVALMLVASALATNATAEPTVSSTSNGIPGIEITDSGSIPENIAAELRSSSAGDLLRYAIVVHNTGSLSVTGMVIRYEISANGKADLMVQGYLSPSNVPIRESPSIIAPGGSFIIVPFHKLNGAGMETEVRGNGIQSTETRADFLNSADRVTIEVDYVIRSDGTIVGPDRSLQFHLFQREISEYTEFRNQLLQLFAEGATVADISAWLQQTADQQVVHQTNEPRDDLAIMEVKIDAHRYLRLVQNQGLQYAWDSLKVQTPEKTFSWFYKVHQGMNQ